MHQSFPILRTDRLLLKQFRDNDIEQVFRGLSHPDVIKYYGVNYNSLAETEAQMKWFSSLELDRTGIWWAIYSSDGSYFYGATGFSNLSVVHKKAEIGFWLLPMYWGKKIMQEAVSVVCEYGFEQLKLHRIEAFVETENKNCKKLIGKLNFSHEGTMQDCEIKNGEFISLDIYAKLYRPS